MHQNVQWVHITVCPAHRRPWSHNLWAFLVSLDSLLSFNSQQSACVFLCVFFLLNRCSAIHVIEKKLIYYRDMFRRAFVGKRKAISDYLEVEYGLLEDLKDRNVITDQHFKHLKVIQFPHVRLYCATLIADFICLFSI